MYVRIGSVFYWKIIIDGLLAKTNTQFKVFPTPSKDILYIQNTNQAERYSACIYDAFGRMVQETKGSPNALDISRLSPGVYVLQIRQEARWSLYKIIVQ